ncbi:hypothetical protein BBK36DRAFT_1172751 [Trichoderma citrinoviride]|uniref:Tat pathway signal sequence n=1 Tax=Trichoderma citrinoviride TaxID=58853 RepID=A0A2T4AYP5_9HYPO|nr:hypothetical protein BBK36DRAFT_1172751 [Trichoderma citrinoviride]PTB62195.1 hypothetical protein BBK36DRAFT_1172751 [Trichoderma citrinoviride]
MASKEPLPETPERSSTSTLGDYELDTQYLMSNEKARKRNSSQQKRNWVFLAVNSFILLLNIGALLMMGVTKTVTVTHRENEFPDLPHQEWIDGVIDWELQVYDDQFTNHGQFRGVPRPELDDAWSEILQNFTLRIPKPGWRNASTPTSILTEWGDEEGGIMGTFSFLHNIHCLRTIRQYMLPDAYPKIAEKYKPGPNSPIPTHIDFLDHCIDILRQSELCHADMALMTFEWREGEHDPVNIHHTPHVCANPNKITKFLEQHTVFPFGLLRNPFNGEVPTWETNPV